jgi:hypothetical protein
MLPYPDSTPTSEPLMSRMMTLGKGKGMRWEQQFVANWGGGLIAEQ